MTKDDYEETLDIMKYADSIFWNEPILDIYQSNGPVESRTNLHSFNYVPERNSKSHLNRNPERQIIKTSLNNVNVNKSPVISNNK